MIILAFIGGLFLGLSVYIWQWQRLNHKMRNILANSTQETKTLPALSTISLLRREINRHEQQYQQLQESLDEYQQLLELAPIGYLQVDQENCLTWANQEAIKFLSIDRWQPGQKERLLLELVRSYELDQLIEKTRTTQSSQICEWVFYATKYDFQDTKGENSSICLRGFSLPLPQQEVGVFLENRQSLVELSRFRDRAFSDLTHELRTPLTSILLVAEALQKSLQGAQLRWIEQLLRELTRLISLVEDFSELSKLQTNPSQQLKLEPVDLKEIIFSVWQTLQPLADRKNLNLAYLGVDTLVIEGDKSRLMRVFLNLLDNSIKFSPSAATISVEVTNTSSTSEGSSLSGAEINIIDAGCGFAEEDLPYVFDRLYRGDTSRVRSFSQSDLAASQGSGLGLAIVQQIILAHGGSITAQNSPDTYGAWLQIKLPM